jgi:histidinol dehydrogenase
VDYTEKFYQQSLNLQQLKVSGSELDAAYQQVSQDLLNAIAVACAKMEAFHRQRLPKAWVQFPEDGTVRGNVINRLTVWELSFPMVNVPISVYCSNRRFQPK